jgi:hypothetical protein
LFSDISVTSFLFNYTNHRNIFLHGFHVPYEVTAAAIEEGRRIASDSGVKGYSSMDALRKALEE